MENQLRVSLLPASEYYTSTYGVQNSQSTATRHVTATTTRLQMHVGRALLLVTNTPLIIVLLTDQMIMDRLDWCRHHSLDAKTRLKMNMRILSHTNHSRVARREKNDR